MFEKRVLGGALALALPFAACTPTQKLRAPADLPPQEQFHELLHELGAREGAPDPALRDDLSETDTSPARPAFVERVVDDDGRLSGLFAFSERGLASIQSKETPQDALLRFLGEHPRLLRRNVRADDELDLELRWDEKMQSPAGRYVRRVEFDQRWHGHRVLDAQVVGIFWDDVLTTVTGPVLPDDEDFGSSEPKQSASEAKEAARGALHNAGWKGNFDLAIEALGLSLQDHSLVYLVHADPRAEAGRGTRYEDPVLVHVHAMTGEPLRIQDLSAQLESVPNQYRVYKPDPAVDDAYDMTVQLVDGHAVLNRARDKIYPWLDELDGWGAPRSPVVHVTGVEPWLWGDDDRTNGFHWHRADNPDFTHGPGRPAHFAQQHAAAHAQRGLWVSDRNMQWWPTSDPAYRSSEVVVISQFQGGSRAWANGCPAHWGDPFLRRGDKDQNPRTQCVRLSGNTGDTYGGANSGNPTTRVGTIWHEIGHAVDFKYRHGHVRGGAFERRSLGEAVADLYVMMMFFHEYGLRAGFTDFDSEGGNFSKVTYSIFSRTAVVHTDGGDLRCTPNESDHTHNFGLGLLQAVWESAHSRNCGFEPCRHHDDGSYTDQARWAYFYSLKNTGLDDGYDDFSGHFLSYYYYDVEYWDWARRWWIFNHHGLVGEQVNHVAQYGEGSPCF